MNKTFVLISVVILSIFFRLNTFAQCHLVIDTVYYNGDFYLTPDTIKICQGDQVSFAYSDAGCPTYMMDNNFNNGQIGIGWSSNASPMFNNPCGPGVDGTTYLWIGPATSFPRRLTTVNYNVTTQCQICFDMKYASQSNSSPCEGPDESTEGVHLQYSTVSATGPWIDINYWDPNGGYDPNLTTWQHYCENVPINGTVWFSWYQDVTSGNDYDHWGLDNVQIFCPPPSQTIQSTYNSNLVSTNTYHSTISPNTSGYFVATVSDGSLSASDSVYVDVYPPPTISISGLNNSYCVTDMPSTLTGSPTPGVFSGPGISGNAFDPSIAGVGTHTITYHHYYITTNSATGNLTFFYDDFSTDKGWTGYGTEWTRGPATASTGCSGSQDPAQDHTTTTDNYIIGNWLGGCYPNSMNQTYWLTSPVIDCSNLNNCNIEFYSHSGVETPTYDHLYIEAYNGSTWQQIWANTATLNETAWTLRTYPVAQATNNPNFRVRFGIGPTDASVIYKGWNIDDFKVKCDGSITITDTLCDFTTTQDVTVLAQPTSTFTYTDSICPNSTTTIQYTGTASSNATYTWDFGGGTIISGSGSGPYTVQYSNDGDYTISLTVNDNGCSSTQTAHTLTVLPFGHPYCCIMPTTNAGADDSICGLNYTLNAIASVGNGTWTQLTGIGNSTFQNIHDANTSVTVNVEGTYTYEWHEVNGSGCENRDTVAITFIQQPIANAGSDISVCQLSSALNASSTAGLGTWTQISGPGTVSFDNNHNPTATATATQQGTYVLQWTEDNQGCTSSDQVSLILTNQPIANAGIDTAVCSFTYQLNAIPSYGTGTWLNISGPGSAQFSNINSPNSMVQVSTHGMYTFVWNEDNSNGCISNDTVQITFNYIPTSSFTLPSINCYNDTITITYTGNATPQATYTWDFGNATVISGIGAGPYAITNNQTGTFSVSLQITQNNCTSSTTTLQTTNPEPISLSLSKVDVTCFGYNDGLVTSNTTGGTPPYSYHWNNGSFFSNISQAEAGWYFLTVTDQNGCKAMADITVFEPAKLSINMIDSIAICKDSTITISASVTGGTYPYTFQWNNGVNTNSITVTPSTTTIYSLIVKDSKQCYAQKSVKVFVYPPLTFTATANTDSICLGEQVIINTQTSGGMGAPYQYFVNGLFNSTPIYLYPNNSQSYQITVKDGCNYTAMVDVPIYVYPSPSINPSSNITSGCMPLTVQFNESSPDLGQQYVWDFGDNSSAFSRNPKHTFNNSGTYTINLTVTTINGCHVTNTFPNWITVYPLPHAQFISDPSIANVIKPEINFINYSTLSDSVMWFFGDGDSTNIYNPYHLYPADTPNTYQVTLVVFTNKGCSDTVHGVVMVRDVYTFYAPTAFSPDGDQINEVFYVTGHGIKEETFSLTIFDRWGEIVFETNNIHEGWDGRIKGGQIAPVGTYTWIAKFKDFQKIAHDEYGKVTIIR